MTSTPAATAGYMMAKAMGANTTLAANIIAFTSVFSMIGMGMAILRMVRWV